MCIGSFSSMTSMEGYDDWSAVAFFYLDSPENALPPLAAVAERTAGMSADPLPR
jgi:hypothetical protein